MADKPRTDDGDIERRLAAWFDGEVRQARADLAGSRGLAPVSTRPRPSNRATLGQLGSIAAAAVLAVAALVGLQGGSRDGLDPSESAASFAASQTAGTTPRATGITARFADGIPSVIDGEPVLRPPDLARLAPADDTAFLLGGWWPSGIVMSCAPRAPSPTPTPRPFLYDCAHNVIGETPSAWNSPHVEIVLPSSGQHIGPVVVRVHRHDARAQTCATPAFSSCDSAAVIEQVVWEGDEVTDTMPISTLNAIGVIGLEWGAIPNIHVEGADVPCDPGFPIETWFVDNSLIDVIAVYPNVQSREATDERFTALGWVGIDCLFAADNSFTWVAVQNVRVGVSVVDGGQTQAERDLVERIQAFLEGRL